MKKSTNEFLNEYDGDINSVISDAKDLIHIAKDSGNNADVLEICTLVDGSSFSKADKNKFFAETGIDWGKTKLAKGGKLAKGIKEKKKEIEQKLKDKGVKLSNFSNGGYAVNGTYKGADIEEYNYGDKKLPKSICNLLDQYNNLQSGSMKIGGKLASGGAVSVDTGSIKEAISECVHGTQDRATHRVGNIEVDMVYEDAASFLTLHFFFYDINDRKEHYATYELDVAKKSGKLITYGKDEFEALINETKSVLKDFEYNVSEVVSYANMKDGGELPFNKNTYNSLVKKVGKYFISPDQWIIYKYNEEGILAIENEDLTLDGLLHKVHAWNEQNHGIDSRMYEMFKNDIEKAGGKMPAGIEINNEYAKGGEVNSIFKKIGKNTWEYSGEKYDAAIRKERGVYVIDIFDATIENPDEALLESNDGNETLEDAENYFKEAYLKIKLEKGGEIFFQTDDNVAARKEGWMIKYEGVKHGKPLYELIQVTATPINYDEVIKSIVEKANTGSVLHEKALAFIKKYNEEEWHIIKSICPGDGVFLDGISIDKYIQGSGIGVYDDEKICDYGRKTPEQIWNEWIIEQRKHFLEDHFERIRELSESTNRRLIFLDDAYAFALKQYSELPSYITAVLAAHIAKGQYRDGGKMDEGGKFESDKKQFRWVDKTNQEKPMGISKSHIEKTWPDLNEKDINTGKQLRTFLDDCQIGEAWESKMERLECFEPKQKKEAGGELTNHVYILDFKQYGETKRAEVRTEGGIEQAKNMIHSGYGIPLSEITLHRETTSDGFFKEGVYNFTTVKKDSEFGVEEKAKISSIVRGGKYTIGLYLPFRIDLYLRGKEGRMGMGSIMLIEDNENKGKWGVYIRKYDEVKGGYYDEVKSGITKSEGIDLVKKIVRGENDTTGYEEGGGVKSLKKGDSIYFTKRPALKGTVLEILPNEVIKAEWTDNEGILVKNGRKKVLDVSVSDVTSYADGGVVVEGFSAPKTLITDPVKIEYKKGGETKKAEYWYGGTRNEKVYEAMLKEAAEDKKWAEEKVKEVGREWKEGSQVSREMLNEYLDKPIEDMARESYNYLALRAHAISDNSKYFATPNFIDKPAKEKWEKLSGEKIVLAKGGGLEGFFSKAKKTASELLNKGAEKSAELYHTGKVAVKETIHDQKKKIALDVLEETRGKVDTKKEASIVHAADNIVEEVYAEGGKVDSPNAYDYMLLGRLQSDCDYFLGHGNRSERHLWAGNVHDQIEKMKSLWSSLPEKPEWLSMEDILDYERKMKNQYAEGGIVDPEVERMKKLYSEADIEKVKKDGTVVIPNTIHGTLYVDELSYGVFEINDKKFKNLYRGDEAGALKFISDSFIPEVMYRPSFEFENAPSVERVGDFFIKKNDKANKELDGNTNMFRTYAEGESPFYVTFKSDNNALYLAETRKDAIIWIEEKMFGKSMTYVKGGEIDGFNVDEVLKHYMIAALWSSDDTENDDTPFDQNYGIEDFDTASKESMKRDVVKFLTENKKMLKKSELSDEQIGHDLWLTRNGHGAGFWDRDLDKEIGDALTASAKAFKECNLYAENGKVKVDPLSSKMASGGEVEHDMLVDADGKPYSKTMKYYQPKDAKAYHEEGLSSYEAFKSKEKCEKAFPGEVVELEGDDIEHPKFVDDEFIFEDAPKKEKGGGLGNKFNIGDLAFVKDMGHNGLVGLVLSDPYKDEDDIEVQKVYYRGYSGDIIPTPVVELIDLLQNRDYLYRADNNGDISAYESIAKKQGITLNPIYEEAIGSEYEEEDNEEYADGGEITETTKDILSKYIFEYHYPKYKKNPEVVTQYVVNTNKVIPIGGMSENGFELRQLNGSPSNVAITAVHAMQAIRNGEIELETAVGYFVKVRAIKKDKMGSGFEIKNQYIDKNFNAKTPKEIWKAWSVSQRNHFIEDHKDAIYLKYDKKNNTNLPDLEYEQLPVLLKNQLAMHIGMGEYRGGGKVNSWHRSFGDKQGTPLLSFSKNDYTVNVDLRNLEVDVNIKDNGNDSVDQIALNDTDAEWHQERWGYMVYPKTKEQVVKVLKALNVKFSEKRVEQALNGKQYAEGGNVRVWYQGDYYDKMDGHGAMQYSSSDFKAVYRDAMDFYNREKRKKDFSRFQYIGVNGSGNEFAIMYIDKDYLDSMQERDFKSKSAFDAWIAVAKKVMETGKPQKGKFNNEMAEGGEIQDYDKARSENHLPKKYYTEFKLPKHTGKVTVLDGGESDTRKLMRKLFPGMSQEEHKKLRDSFFKKMETAQKELDAAYDKASMDWAGRPFSVTEGDYKISGIGRDEYTNENKYKILHALHKVYQYKDASRAHNYMLPSKQRVKYAEGGEVNEWKSGSSIKYKNRAEAKESMDLKKNHNESNVEYRNLRVEKIDGDKLNRGYVVNFEYKNKFAKGGEVKEDWSKRLKLEKRKATGKYPLFQLVDVKRSESIGSTTTKPKAEALRKKLIGSEEERIKFGIQDAPAVQVEVSKPSFYATYNDYGYEIWEDGKNVVYKAGNNKNSSEIDQSVPLEDSNALSLEKIKEYAEKTGKEIAQENHGDFTGAQFDEVYAKGGEVGTEVKSNEDFLKLINKWAEKYRVVSSSGFEEGDSPYSKGFVDDGEEITVSLHKESEKGKPTYYVWKWQKKYAKGGNVKPARKKKYWIADAIVHKGHLINKAKKLGIIKGDQKLTIGKLNKMRKLSDNWKSSASWKHGIDLAERLMRMHKKEDGGDLNTIDGVKHEKLQASDIDYTKLHRLKEWHEATGGTKHPFGTVYSDGNFGYVQNGYDWLKFDLHDLENFDEEEVASLDFISGKELEYINAVLANDSDSTDEELVNLFMSELHLTPIQAKYIIGFRKKFFENNFYSLTK